jgi:hypothetical protein
MKRINSLVQKLSSAALHVTALALVVGFLGAPGKALASTGSGTTCPGGQTIFESSAYTAAGCLFTSGPTAPNMQSCNNQNLTIFLPSNSGTCMICVQAKYAALVANDTLNQEANPAGYLYLPTWFAEPALTLDQYAIQYFDGVHTPFRCLKCAQPPSGSVGGEPDGELGASDTGWSKRQPGGHNHRYRGVRHRRTLQRVCLHRGS